MNWGITEKRNLIFFLISILISSNLVALEDHNGIKGEDDIIVISDENTQGLIAKSDRSLFKVKAKYNGVISIDSDGLSDKIGLVTVFSSDYKEIVVQSLHRNNEPISFISKAGEEYYIIWQFKQNDIDLKWSVKQLEERGISSSNAIIASEGLMEVSHKKGYDSWFVYTAERDGQIALSSYGHTNENTCLFVYDKSGEIVVGSSNFTKGTLQSEVIVDVKEGETYFIKWSNAFTNGNYNWTLAYL